MDRYADGDASAFPILYDAIAPRIEGLRETEDARRLAHRRHRATDVRAHSPRARHLHSRVRRALVGVQNRPQPVSGLRRAGVARAARGRTRTARTAKPEPIPSPRRSPRWSTPSASRRRARRWRRLVRAFRALPERATAGARAGARRGLLDGGRGREPRRHASQLKMSVFRGAAALRDAVLGRRRASRRARAVSRALSHHDRREHLRGVT